MSWWAEENAPWARWAFAACAVTIALLGLAFRSAGYFDGSISLWYDEVAWFRRLLDRPITGQLYRPIGYMWLTRSLLGVWSGEAALRFFAYLPSLLVIPLVYLISARVFRSPLTTLVALFVFCLQPVLIAYAKEFKPYSGELCVHLGLIWLTLRQLETGSLGRLALLLGGCVAAPLLAYNVVFLFPSVVLAVAGSALRHRDWWMLGFVFGLALVLVGILLGLQQLLWSTLDFARQETYWGNKYDVFSLAESPVERLAWLTRRYLGLVRAAGTSEVFWNFGPAQNLLAGLLWTAQAAGLLAIALRRQLTPALLFVLPLAVTIAFNQLGMWPFGAHRTNLFAFGYVNFISLLGLDAALSARMPMLRSAARLLAAVFTLLQLPLDLSYHAVKPSGSMTYHSEMRSVLQTIRDYERSHPETPSTGRILADSHSKPQIDHYLSVPPASTPEQRAFFAKFRILGVGPEAEKLKDAILRLAGAGRNRNKGVWVIISKPPLFERFSQDPWIRERTLFEKNFHGGNLLLYVVVPERQFPPRPPRAS